MPQFDLALQADLAVRMLIAAVFGAAIGLEREIHEHPAGMRTHLLVSLGSAIFTELSIFGFNGGPAPNGSLPTDTSRIAAQVVSGIGFLGAGAILKYGTSIRGLTTAASLWATAAIGMATGAGEWLIAAVGTFIVVFSLWPTPSSSTCPPRSCTRPTGLSGPCGGESGCGRQISSARGPAAANDAPGCVLRTTPGCRQNSSAVMPMPSLGVERGSNTLAPSVIVGMTSVPSGPTDSRRAATSPSGPPSTGRTARNEVCTRSTPPRRTPSVFSRITTASRTRSWSR